MPDLDPTEVEFLRVLHLALITNQVANVPSARRNEPEARARRRLRKAGLVHYDVKRWWITRKGIDILAERYARRFGFSTA